MNGKKGDNPLSDLTIHGISHFPPDIAEAMLRIEALGERDGRWPLGENWPYSPREFDWEQGRDLDQARELLAQLERMLEAGRGDEILVHPLTKRPLTEDDRPRAPRK
jgi:hypothetical protein